MYKTYENYWNKQMKSKTLPYVFAIISLFGVVNAVIADTACFIAQTNGKIIKQEGNCNTRHSPCSTFKIALSVMGYNEGILIDKTHPKWPYKPEYFIVSSKICQQAINPTTWIKNGCIWYSQVIASKLGITKFKEYLAKFNYGNQDASGDKGKDNGLTASWLSSSLQISPIEQIEFLAKLLAAELPATKQAQAYTRNIFLDGPWLDGWNLYGKTGTGYLVDSNGVIDDNSELGWFVGWIEKGSSKIIFAQYIESHGQHSFDIPAGVKAKELSMKNLSSLIVS